MVYSGSFGCSTLKSEIMQTLNNAGKSDHIHHIRVLNRGHPVRRILLG